MGTPVFLGYGSRPEVNRETLLGAARALTLPGRYEARSWEELRIDGQLIIHSILRAIDESEIALFDLTTLNPNVPFELGYSIAKHKRIGLLLEGGSESASTNLRRFSLLQGVGYFQWTDQGSIVARVSSGSFDDALPLGDELLNGLTDLQTSSLFFLPALHRSEPDARIRSVVQKAADQRVKVVVADPDENRLETLTWYASKAYASAAVLLHFEAPRRTGHEFHNARLAFVAGLSHGYGRRVLMLADVDYEVPLDYANLMRAYRSVAEAESTAAEWIESANFERADTFHRPRLELAVELRGLTFGEHVAENEIQILPSYFIATAEYQAVLDAHLSIFVGRKGSGKSANLFLAAAELASDPRVLPVVIRPAAYDFQGLIGVMSTYEDLVKAYAIEGIWKLLLLSEVARTLLERLDARPAGVPLSVEEQEFFDGVTQGPVDVRRDFGSQIDAVIQSLEQEDRLDVESRRDLLNESLHTDWISRVRHLVSPVVTHFDRVAILVDNLDKGWERSADLDATSDLLLGLLSTVGKVERELVRDLPISSNLAVTLSVFLRSDIFAHVKERAREPDKIVASVVQWSDGEVLRRVVEERFLSSRRPGTLPKELWDRFFCADIDGESTPEYLLRRVLPRPRDLIFLCNAAVGVAINRGHQQVEASDIRAAEMLYSQFAFEALLVENGITQQEFESVLLEFLGSEAIMSKAEVLEHIASAGFHDMRAEQILTRLKAVSFLGIETKKDRFDFPEIGRATEKAEILARKTAKTEASTRHIVHPAYRPFLEIVDVEAEIHLM